MPTAGQYRLMYRLGFTPWDTGKVPAELDALGAATTASAPGRALEIGCGTGTNAVHLAQQGWDVTAVDSAPKALANARRRAQLAGVKIDWREQDVAKLSDGLTPGYGLIYDIGCFHTLPDPIRDQWAHGVTTLAAPGAVLLVCGFPPGHRAQPARGMTQHDLLGRLGPDWQLVQIHTDTDFQPHWFVGRDRKPTWYRLLRRADPMT